MHDALLSWLPTYLLHSTALLGTLWALERIGVLSRLTCVGVERLWRAALLAGVASATLVVAPWSARPVAPATRPLPVVAAVAGAAGVATPATAVAAAPSGTPFATPAVTAERGAPAQVPAARDAGSAWAAAALALAALWIAVAALALARLVAQWWAVRVAVARCAPVADARWRRHAAEIAARLRVPAPRIVHAAGWQGPVLAPGGVLCLPGWTLGADDETVRAILLHELAHLRRHDLAWRLLHEVMRRALWLQPLNRIAVARLELQAELACDAYAIDPRERAALAGSLLSCAERIAAGIARRSDAASQRLACAVAGQRSPLGRRVRTLLMGQDTAPPAQRRLRAGAAIALLACVAVAAPVVAVRHDDVLALLDRIELPVPHDWIGRHGNVVRIESPTAGGHLAVELRGDATFADDERGLVSLAGTLRVRERDAALERRLLATGSPGGGIDYAYEENGRPRALDDAGHAWLGSIVARLAGVITDPRERARRLMARGGLDDVLRDLERHDLDGDARRQRIEGLLSLPGTPPPVALGRAIGAATLIGDRHVRREALCALAATAPLDETLQQAWLRSLATIDDDFELRTGLAVIAPRLSHAPAVLAAWREAVGRLHGSFDLRESLRTQLEAGADPALLAQVLDASMAIDDPFNRRELLVQVATRLQGDEAALVDGYVRAVEGMAGDFERHEALLALLGRPLQPDGLAAVLGAASRIADTRLRLDVLEGVALRAPHDAAFAARIRAAGRGMAGYERGELEVALDPLGS